MASRSSRPSELGPAKPLANIPSLSAGTRIDDVQEFAIYGNRRDEQLRVSVCLRDGEVDDVKVQMERGRNQYFFNASVSEIRRVLAFVGAHSRDGVLDVCDADSGEPFSLPAESLGNALKEAVSARRIELQVPSHDR
jgi:hypothetical protein